MMSSIKSLVKKPELFASELFFIYFIIETPDIVVGNRIVSKVYYSPLPCFAAFYVLAKTAYFPFFIEFFVSVGHNSLYKQ